MRIQVIGYNVNVGVDSYRTYERSMEERQVERVLKAGFDRHNCHRTLGV